MPLTEPDPDLTIAMIPCLARADLNSWPLACHADPAPRPAVLDVAPCAVGLRQLWPTVAWRLLVSGAVGSQLGSQTSVSPANVRMTRMPRPVGIAGGTLIDSRGPGRDFCNISWYNALTAS